MYPKSITIKSESQGERLDKFLVKKLVDFSRTQIQKLIQGEQILVNGKKATVHQFLKTGDKIKITNYNQKIASSPRQGGAPRNDTAPNTARHDNPLTPKIVAEEKDFLIIEKPADLLVHPTKKEETDTLADWLLASYPELKKIGDDPQRPAIVHRLDKEVSGLMIIPKNQTAFDYFKIQFQLHKIIKKYWGLVYGQIQKDEDEINFAISRSATKPGLFAAQPKNISATAKKALTIFSVIKRFKNYTLLEIQILTGRTHQIRVHLLAYGHPIVGDKLYQIKKYQDKINAPRIFLHANQLEFIGPDGQPYKFDSCPPKDLESILNNLK